MNHTCKYSENKFDANIDIQLKKLLPIQLHRTPVKNMTEHVSEVLIKLSNIGFSKLPVWWESLYTAAASRSHNP